MHRLCRPDAFEEGKAFEYELTLDPLSLSAEGGRRRDPYAHAGRLSVILLQWQGQKLAYRNICPHRGTPLNLLPDRFFDLSGRYLQCKTHGALFRPDDGVCIAGPCAGQGLIALPICEQEGWVVLDL